MQHPTNNNNNIEERSLQVNLKIIRVAQIEKKYMCIEEREIPVS